MIVLEWFHKVLDFIEKDASYINSKMMVCVLSLKLLDTEVLIFDRSVIVMQEH